MNKTNYNHVDLLAQHEEVRSAVRVTEVTGTRTVFTREGRNVAILLSWDEYLALAETVRLAGDPARVERIRAADEELTRSGGPSLDDPSAETIHRAPGAAGAEGSSSDRESERVALAAIAANPIAGVPLFDPLRGFWVYREGTVRVVYRVSRDGSMAGVVLIDRGGEGI